MRTPVNLQSNILLPTEQADMEIYVERDFMLKEITTPLAAPGLEGC